MLETEKHGFFLSILEKMGKRKFLAAKKDPQTLCLSNGMVSSQQKRLDKELQCSVQVEAPDSVAELDQNTTSQHWKHLCFLQHERLFCIFRRV